MPSRRSFPRRSSLINNTSLLQADILPLESFLPLSIDYQLADEQPLRRRPSLPIQNPSNFDPLWTYLTGLPEYPRLEQRRALSEQPPTRVSDETMRDSRRN